MNKKIFHSSMIVAILVLLTSIALIFGILFDYFENQIQEELKSEASYISYAVENEGISYVDYFSGNNKRITVIDKSGKVLADTSADIQTLDNHANRKEVHDALETGSGTSIRYSDTLTEKTVYYAQKMSDGNVLRVSATRYSVLAILFGLLQQLLVVLVIAFIISFLLSRRLSKLIITPINEIDLDNPEENVTYDELSPLLRRLSIQKHTIENQLDEANKKREEFRLITENMNEGFIVIDNHTHLLTYNSAALNLLEIDEVKAGSVLMLNRTKGFRTVIEKALNGERSESDIVLGERSYNLIANPVKSNEKIIGAVIVIFDVTERMEREQLRREFTSNVSHELKTPLTSISGFAEIMKSGDISRETVVDFSTSIYDEAQRLISLVSDIIKISEIDEKSVQFEQEAIDLYAVSSDVINYLRPSAGQHSITLNLIGESTCITGVHKIIEEMLYNLCDNAIKYNKENGCVDIILASSDTNASVTVRDTGIGIPMNAQNRVFERFYRVDKSHSKSIGGTGLGLSIVKHGAMYHNADISMKSVVGKGTSITLTFPKEFKPE